MENSELLNLEEFLPYRLSVLSNTVSRGISAAYVDRFGLSIREWRIIAVLGRYPGLSAAEIVKLTAMDKVAVSRAVSRLTGKGRLTRSLSDADKRRSVLVLSKEGKRLSLLLVGKTSDDKFGILKPFTVVKQSVYRVDYLIPGYVS
ncbi:MAG: MarR family transcriptional regulator [Proteobacteria bacterium]|nr:MarR family transcriptional regulator [Pseudomonadota bacterium]